MMDTSECKAAFESCRGELWGEFEAYVVQEVGGLGELNGLDASDLRAAVQDFFTSAGVEASSLRRAKCAKCVQEMVARGAAVHKANVESSQLRRRKGGEERTEVSEMHKEEKKEKKQPKKGDNMQDLVDEMTFNHQVMFMLFKTALTLVVFTFLHYLANGMEFLCKKSVYC